MSNQDRILGELVAVTPAQRWCAQRRRELLTIIDLMERGVVAFRSGMADITADTLRDARGELAQLG